MITGKISRQVYTATRSKASASGGGGFYPPEAAIVRSEGEWTA